MYETNPAILMITCVYSRQKIEVSVLEIEEFILRYGS